MVVYKYGDPEANIVLIQPVGDHDVHDIENEVSLISYRREVSFEQVKEELKDKFKNKGNISFFELIKSYSQKNEVVLVFMGILAMIKDQELLCVDKDSGIILEYKSKEN